MSLYDMERTGVSQQLHKLGRMATDCATRLTIGVFVAIPAASLCINRRLYKIAACQTKRRTVMVDCAIEYVVQGHRYNIMEDVGCYPTTYNTPLAYPLSYLWPNIIGLVSACYCILTLREFNRRRAQFALLLSASSSSSPLSLSRYFRLMALATVELVFNTPISAYGLYLTITHDQIQPWISWANTHFEFSVIDVFPSLVWRADPATVVTIELSRWAVVFCAFVFFAFFGFAAEARKNYAQAFWALATRVGYERPVDGRLPWSKAKSASGAPALPISLHRTAAKPRPDSLTASLADTRTDYDDDAAMEKSADYLVPTPSSSGSAPPQYIHDIELGVYTGSPTPTASEYSHRTLDSARPRPHVADAFFPAAAITRPAPPSPNPRSPRPSTWPSLPASPHAPAS
ncbi:pheromone A receptor-domain-containing protein [Mycena galericulata]|nr:pheromone A receptor-domain-containing protein [Mycena galericulata]